ncbi:MAG: amino acid-binding protein [Clostridia bacterium]|nr:amino acid-binding protein [Clostridia bacterium]
MLIKQLSVFLENKQGKLRAALQVLADKGVNISALSLADTSDFGILRLIVDDPEKAKEVLTETGVVVLISHVLAIAMDDVPGGMAEILHQLADAELNIEYMYACVGRQSGKALTIMRLDDTKRAEELLSKGKHGQVNPSDIYRL